MDPWLVAILVIVGVAVGVVAGIWWVFARFMVEFFKR